MNLLKPMSDGWHRRAFGGVAYPAGAPMPESATPILHVEDDAESGLLVDRSVTPEEKLQPKSLFELVTTRLQSVKPRNKKRAHEVAKILADLQEPLLALDELFATLDAERVEDLQETWEALQTQGRELKKRIESELTGDVYTAMLAWNAAEEKKGHAKGRLQQAFEARRTVKLDRYSTRENLKSAEERYRSALQALETASAEHLEAERKKAEAENAKLLASSKLRGIEMAMDQCVAEIQGVAYHDPNNFGLSTATPARIEQ
jgi:chromosome segregation ATPase